jgi:hypothetical protein
MGSREEYVWMDRLKAVSKNFDGEQARFGWQ